MPTQGETKDAFMRRCMSSEEAKRDFPDHKQRVAFCLSTFRKKQQKNS